MKLDITIPTELSEIKLSQFQKYLKVIDGLEDANRINRLAVGIFCNLPDAAVNAIRANDFDAIVNVINETLNKTSELVPTFKHNGKEYGFIPKIEDITVGEKVDIDAFITDWQTMHKAMAVCYREIDYKHKNTYIIKDYKGDEEPLDVTLDVAFGVMVFFSNLINDLQSYIPNFIEREVAANPKAQQILERSGVGIKTFTQSLEGTFLTLRMSKN